MSAPESKLAKGTFVRLTESGRKQFEGQFPKLAWMFNDRFNASRAFVKRVHPETGNITLALARAEAAGEYRLVPPLPATWFEPNPDHWRPKESEPKSTTDKPEKP